MAELSHTGGPLARTVRIACLTLGFAGAMAWPARGGSLQLDAPAGARVSIDGRHVGVAPLSGPVPLDPGPHTVRLELSGAHVSEADLGVGPDNAIVHLTMRMSAKSRANAAARSVVLAGLGQQYVGRRKLGWTLTAAEVGGVAIAALGQLMFQQSEDDFNDAQAVYATSLDAGVLEAARRDANQAYDDMGSAESLRNAGLVVAGAAVLASVMDAWFRFPQLQLGAAPPTTARTDGDAAAGSAFASQDRSTDDGAGFYLSLRGRF